MLLLQIVRVKKDGPILQPLSMFSIIKLQHLCPLFAIVIRRKNILRHLIWNLWWLRKLHRKSLIIQLKKLFVFINLIILKRYISHILSSNAKHTIIKWIISIKIALMLNVLITYNWDKDIDFLNKLNLIIVQYKDWKAYKTVFL